MPQQWINNWTSALATAAAAADTALTVASADAGLLGAPSIADFYLLTLEDGSKREIVRVIGRTGDTLTVERGAEGTTALDWAAGTLCEIRITAAGLTALREADRILTAGGDTLVGDDGNVLTQ